MFKAVVFDLDDTLIHEMDYVNSGFIAVAEYLSSIVNKSPQYIYEKLIKLFEVDTKEVFNRVLKEFEISHSDHLVAQLVNIYREHQPDIRLIGDVLETFQSLRSNKIKIGIITDGFRISQRQKIKVLGLEELVDHIIVTDELGNEFWKPHIKAFKMMRDFFDLKYSEMMYVGDNPSKDFHIGYLTEMTTVRIVREFSVHSDKPYFNGHREKYKISNLFEINELIKKESE